MRRLSLGCYACLFWMVLACTSTDHGRLDDGGPGGRSFEERTIFYLASGVTVDPAWGLDGVVRRQRRDP